MYPDAPQPSPLFSPPPTKTQTTIFGTDHMTRNGSPARDLQASSLQPLQFHVHAPVCLRYGQSRLIMNTTVMCWPTMLKHDSKNDHSKAGVFLNRDIAELIWPCENKADHTKSMSQVTVDCSLVSVVLLTFNTDVAGPAIGQKAAAQNPRETLRSRLSRLILLQHQICEARRQCCRKQQSAVCSVLGSFKHIYD